MRQFLLITTITTVALVVFLGVLLVHLHLASDGRVGDEGIVIIPIVLVLIPTVLTGIVTAIIYLIAKRPKGSLLILPVVMLLIPAAIVASFPIYGAYQHRNGLIGVDEARTLVAECKVKRFVGSNHNRFKLVFSDNTNGDKYITSDEYRQYKTEFEALLAGCK